MSAPEVLIVGAGPTGLVLALWLNRLGVRLRIVDRAARPGTTSRALGVQARTLEFYRQVGLSDEVVERGLEFAAANLWVRGRKAARAAFGEMGRGLSPFPYILIFPQDEHEQFLIERLAERGIAVERGTELLRFEDGDGCVRAQLRGPDGSVEECEAGYLAGCDGARSTIRDSLRIGFPGGTYAHVFYVADVEAKGPLINHELHAALDDADFLAVFPMKGEERARLIGTVRWELDERREALTWDDVSKGVIDRLRLTVDRVNWFSTYRVHHRVADRFRQGRVFLLGDAAHIHSPVGAQGMNTGIADAVNLAWKLAATLRRRAGTALLDTYEPERIAFARRLVATTDRAFTAVTSPKPLARFIRIGVVPRVLPRLAALGAFRRFMFRTVSQTAVNYRGSALSEGRAGGVRGGDRLPWVQPDAASDRAFDNFTPLTSLDWQVHVYGDAGAGLAEACRKTGLALHTFAWSSAAGRAGLRQGAAYLVRPDGYVGLADPEGGLAGLADYLRTRDLRPSQAAAPERVS
jgi:2-polyprenyl-6-methoxyphenol hydroxylase-like FAD-dependent oxidoreductase